MSGRVINQHVAMGAVCKKKNTHIDISGSLAPETGCHIRGQHKAQRTGSRLKIHPNLRHRQYATKAIRAMKSEDRQLHDLQYLLSSSGKTFAIVGNVSRRGLHEI